MCASRDSACKMQGILPAANTRLARDRSNTGEHIPECEPQVPRGGRAGCERNSCQACFFATCQESSSHAQRLTAFVAAAWPTLNRWLQQGEKQGQGTGTAPPRCRHVSSVVYICRFFLLLFVISTSDSPGKCSGLIKKSSSASCRATRDAAIIRQRVILS